MLARCLAVVAPAALIAAAAVAGPAGATAAGCTGGALSGRFDLQPGSQGAGSVSYVVKLTNHGAACTISGRPGLRLVDRHGRGLPTHVVPDRPGTGTAVLVTLQRGETAVATARFSPDIPSGSEGSPCERAAYHVRILLPSPAHGTVVGGIHPPTAVCSHGRIVLGLLHQRPGARQQAAA